MTERGRYSIPKFRAALRHFVVGKAAQALASMALIAVTVRCLDATAYGTYMLLWGMVDVARPVTSLGLLPVAQRYVPEFAARGASTAVRLLLTWISAGRAALFALCLLALWSGWEYFATWIGIARVPEAVRWLAMALIVGALWTEFTEQMLEALVAQKSASLVRAFVPILRLLGLLILIVADRVSLEHILLVDAIVTIGCLVWAEHMLLANIPISSGSQSDAIDVQDLLKYGWHMFGAQILLVLVNPGILRMIAIRSLGIEMGGQFAFLQQLYNLAKRMLPSLMLINLFRPMLVARYVAQQFGSVTMVTTLLWKVNAVLVLPVVGLMFVAGDELLSLFSGQRVAAGGVAMAWLFGMLAWQAQGQVISLSLQIYGKAHLVRTSSLFLLALPAAMWIGAKYGLAGACAGLAAGATVQAMASVWLSRRQAQSIIDDWAGLGRLLLAMLGATALAALVSMFLPWYHVLWAFPISYLVLLVWLRPLRERELAAIQKTLPGIRSAARLFSRPQRRE